jgi:hypothetical protein
MCKCGTVCPAAGPSLMPILKPSGWNSAAGCYLGLVEQRQQRGALLTADLEEGVNMAFGDNEAVARRHRKSISNPRGIKPPQPGEGRTLFDNPFRPYSCNGMAESFVKTMKRDYIAFMPKPDAATAVRIWLSLSNTTTKDIRIARGDTARHASSNAGPIHQPWCEAVSGIKGVMPSGMAEGCLDRYEVQMNSTIPRNTEEMR